MMNHKISLTLAALFSLAGCAHHRDVRPSESGVHTVVLRVEDQDEGYPEAMAQANHYCEEESGKKKAVTVDEKTEFAGDGDEKSYRRNKKISKAAKIGGFGVGVFGGRRERRVGSGVGLAGAVGDSVLGNGYRYTLKFKCKK